MNIDRMVLSVALMGALLQACSSESATLTADTSSGGNGTGGTSSGGAGGSTSSSGGSSTSSSSGTFVEPTVLAGSFEETASSIALGPTDVYWASLTIKDGGNLIEHGIKKAPKEPGDAVYEVENVWPAAIAVDATHVYWTEGDIVWSRPLGGGDALQVADKQAVQSGSNLVVDEDSVYWANMYAGTVMKAAKDGSSVTTIASGQSFPTRVAVDDTNVYWVDTAEAGAVMSAPKDGSAVNILAADEHSPTAIAVDATDVYWTSIGGGNHVKKAPKGGGAAVDLVQNQFSSAIAVDATDVYWLRTDGVERAPIDGGAHVTLSVGDSGCSEIALDDGFIYWTRNSVDDGGKVLKLAK